MSRQRAKLAKLLPAVAPAMLLAACVSVPRDAGTSDVQQALAAHGVPPVEWRMAGANADDARVAAMLEGELTADEAVAIAAVNSPRLQVSLAGLGIARAELIEASTVANPLFELEIRFPGEPYRPYELRLAESLIGLIQLPRRRAIGRAEFDAAQMQVTSEVVRFAGDVRAAYYGLLAATLQADLSRTAAEAARAAADVAIRQHAAETITDLDLENEQARYEETKLDLARAGQGAILARESLLRLMGIRDANAALRLPASFPALPESEEAEEPLERAAASQRLDAAIARRELEAARRRVPMARLQVLDETVLDFHYEREPSGERTRGPGIEFPIPLFGAGRAARTRAEAEYLRAAHALAAIEASAASSIRSSRAAVAEARARVEYYRDVIVPRRERIVQLTKLEHNAMLVGVFQLLDAKQKEMQARRELVDAQRDYWVARVTLDRALQGVAADGGAMELTGERSGRNVPAARESH